MCHPGKQARQLYGSGCVPCGCGCIPPFRRYYSSEEERERLESYREQLVKELAGVEERIGEMKD